MAIGPAQRIQRRSLSRVISANRHRITTAPKVRNGITRASERICGVAIRLKR